MASFVRVAASIESGTCRDGGGGKEPVLKRRRLLDAGGPIEDDETARQKMRDAEVYERGVDGVMGEYFGFDPDNVGDVKSFCGGQSAKVRHHVAIKPMGHFAKEGDLPMMRWLYVNGADTRDEDVSVGFPMWVAVVFGEMEACKWLVRHGAARDVTRINANGVTPLCGSFSEPHKRTLSRWLILNGALCKDGGTGDLDADLMQIGLNCFNGSARERPELLKWAKEHRQSRFSFDAFLMGTFSTPEYSHAKLRESLLAKIGSTKAVDILLGNTPSHQCPLLWGEIYPQRVGCPLEVFAGKSGILELIGDYVGLLRGHEARIVRQLAELLPGMTAEIDAKLAALYIEGLPDSDDSDSDDSDSE